ncbi:MAG TPA: 23S rRNA (adenine(2503)-C(2))-methyltransferase RlmN [Gemmatimonadales bacterium]|nr:23S rRNA (adenine(2503)-C(2))-methyltransferase RlmN [Gemmatimonadales bacterium]
MPYSTAPEDLAALLAGHPSYRVDQLRRWLYETPVLDADLMTNLPASLRRDLGPRLWPFGVDASQTADGGRTIKWLFRSPDGAAIEAVLMGYRRRTTLCISSQAGCAMGCTFCATGQFGFERHLTAGEIVAQVAYARAHLAAHPMPDSAPRVGNVVFMGMGEPLANYDHVREAIRRMVEVMGMSARSVTVSTVGVVPGIRRLAAEPWPVTLALSLHAADDDLRERLVPLNRRYPIDDLIEAAAAFQASKGRRVSLEWTLIGGVNDTPEQARALAAIAAELRAHVNVIALNPTPLSADRPPSEARVAQFVSWVERGGANVTLRDTRGRDIDAACGQLRIRGAKDGAA